MAEGTLGHHTPDLGPASQELRRLQWKAYRSDENETVSLAVDWLERFWAAPTWTDRVKFKSHDPMAMLGKLYSMRTHSKGELLVREKDFK